MDRLAAHVVATAVLTAALAAVPTAMANPTSADPSPRPTASTTSTSTTTAAMRPTASPAPSPAASTPPSASPLAPAQPSVPAPPQAQPLKRNYLEPFPCPDAQQLGDTTYARWHSVVAFSVKLFHSPKCHEYYGYAYPWLQFRLLKVHYDLGVGVFDVTHDAIDGARTILGGAGGPDFWSSPVTLPAGTCTQALAHVFYPDTETDTFTAKVCV